jgi:hypothetical protein
VQNDNDGKLVRSERDLAMLLIEAVLVLLAIVSALVWPQLGSRWYSSVESKLSQLSRRRFLSIAAIGTGALFLRLTLLPVLPIPYPGVHDEFSYLLMSDTFAHCRLTNPTHPLWTHFESITVIHQPTYCSVFYPGQGLFLAVGQIIGHHPFWGVWLSGGLMCASICWMLQGWFPPFWALLGGILAVIRLASVSYWVNSYFGGTVAAIGGCLVLGALPRIKRQVRVYDALWMGLGFALLANTRPYEGLFFSIPVVFAITLWVWRSDNSRKIHAVRQVVVPVGLVLSATAAFMLYYFWRTTGNLFLPPYIVNVHTYFVDPGFPWLPLRPVPDYRHQVLRDFYLGWNLSNFELARQHPFLLALVKLGMYWFFFFGPLLSLPIAMLAVVLPYGISYKNLRRHTRFLLQVCGLTLLGLMLTSYANPHYAAPLTGAIYALVLMSMQRIRHARWRHQRTGLALVRAVPTIAVILLLVRIAAGAFHLPISNAALPETWCSPWNQNTARQSIEKQLDQKLGSQLVIVRYGAQHDPKEGWVSNSADIDHSKIVWAQDMGDADNRELLEYFRDRAGWLVQPDANPPTLEPYPAQQLHINTELPATEFSHTSLSSRQQRISGQ